MNNEDILKIARGVYPEFQITSINQDDSFCRDNLGNTFHIEFNPLTNDADAFKVLEAGIEKFGYNKFMDALSINHLVAPKGQNLREAICLAWLSLID